MDPYSFSIGRCVTQKSASRVVEHRLHLLYCAIHDVTLRYLLQAFQQMCADLVRKSISKVSPHHFFHKGSHFFLRCKNNLVNAMITGEKDSE